MKNFKLIEDLNYNKGLIHNPKSYFEEAGCVSWLFLVGEEFSKMEGGISFEQVQAATPNCLNVVSDPPRELTLDLARQHVAALNSLPRPTLISCRTGPRASAVAYMYSGLLTGADPEDVIATAEKDKAPFVQNEAYKEWVRSSIKTLSQERFLEK
jgi:hypothetical protein